MDGLPDIVALGTIHGKEHAVAPPLATIGVAVLLADLKTDRFGTFAGDVARTGTMLDAARAKAHAASKATGLPVARASEGAHGPHPFVPFRVGTGASGGELPHAVAASHPQNPGIAAIGELKTYHLS
jgi:hypothetical protein